MSSVDFNTRTSATINTTEVFHCLICQCEQPKLQKFLSDSSQRLSKYFCDLYRIRNTNYRLNIEVIFHDSIVCSPCNQELRDIETLHSQIERLNSEIQRIKVSYDSKLKSGKANSGDHVSETSGIENRTKREQLYNYAFHISRAKPHSVTANNSNLKVSSKKALQLGTQKSNSISDSPSRSNEAIEETLGEDNESYDFDFQEAPSIDFDYEDMDTEHGNDTLYSYVTSTNTHETGSVEVEDPLLETSTAPNWSQQLIISNPHTTTKLKRGKHLQKDRDIVEIDNCTSAEKQTVDNNPDDKTYAVLDDPVDPLALIKTEVEVDDENKSTTESEDKHEWQKNFKLREFSISVERIDMPINQTKPKLQNKKKYVRKKVSSESKLIPRKRKGAKITPANESTSKFPPKPKRKYVRRELGSDPRKKNLPFPCSYPECKRSYSSELQRDGHFKRTHEGIMSPFTCQTCNRHFSCFAELEDHQNVHMGLTPYPCPQCDVSLATKIKLRYHLKTVHNANPFRCEQCDKTLCNNRVYEDHMRSHRKERPFICEICQRSFTNRDILRNHRLTHPELNLGVPECRFCGRVFAGGKYYLEMHERQHMGNVRFKCDVCNFGTSLKTVFTRHMLTHTEKKNFECEICQHKFKSANILNHHKRSYHPVAKNFMCSQCGKCFTCKRYLERHEEIHKEVKRLLCTRCGKSFAQHTSYNYHMKKAHKDDPCVLVTS